MNQIKPLDQVLPIGADAHNHVTKVVNKFGSRDSILYKLKEFSSSVPDFRRSDKGNIRHKLDDIIMLMILGRASGCIGRAEIIEFGKHNLNKFRKMGMLRNGVPSEATLCRVDNGIDDLVMADRMRWFVEAFHGKPDVGIGSCRNLRHAEELSLPARQKHKFGNPVPDDFR